MSLAAITAAVVVMGCLKMVMVRLVGGISLVLKNGLKGWRWWQKLASKTLSPMATAVVSVFMKGMDRKPVAMRSWGC